MIDFSLIEQAQERLSTKVRTTALELSPYLSDQYKAQIYLKLEFQQYTGSFKFRGATNAVLMLTPAQRKKGIVGVSTGNHGRALAAAARAEHIDCVVCMSKLVPQNKVQAIAALGAKIHIVGNSQDEAEAKVTELISSGMTALPPFDHPDIIAGQGSLGIEVLKQLPNADLLVIPVSGGGLISGVALAAKTINPKIKIIGVSMERGAAMYQSLKAGTPVLVEELPTLADSLGGGIGLHNQHTFAMVQKYVDEIVLVTEQEIATAIAHAYWQEGQIMEGSGAVTIASLLSGKVQAQGNTILFSCGKNIDMHLHHRLINGEEVDLLNESK